MRAENTEVFKHRLDKYGPGYWYIIGGWCLASATHSNCTCSPITWKFPIVQVLFQVAHKDIPFNTITWKTEIQPQKKINMDNKKKY